MPAQLVIGCLSELHAALIDGHRVGTEQIPKPR
jgi:hypothetical protein